MKTVRFTKVVEQSGQPEVYLLLLEPKKDPAFQRALKANRIMTLLNTGSGKTDSGTVGYQPDPHAQVLVFPRSLKSFADAHIVGINYDLLKQEPGQKKKAAPPQASPRPKSKPEKKAAQERSVAPPKPVVLSSPKKEPTPIAEKVIPFTKPEPEEEEDENLVEIKTEIRKALKALEAGKQVAAFNILKRLVE